VVQPWEKVFSTSTGTLSTEASEGQRLPLAAVTQSIIVPSRLPFFSILKRTPFSLTEKGLPVTGCPSGRV
jgi:hypothetical protein